MENFSTGLGDSVLSYEGISETGILRGLPFSVLCTPQSIKFFRSIPIDVEKSTREEKPFRIGIGFIINAGIESRILKMLTKHGLNPEG